MTAETIVEPTDEAKRPPLSPFIAKHVLNRAVHYLAVTRKTERALIKGGIEKIIDIYASGLLLVSKRVRGIGPERLLEISTALKSLGLPPEGNAITVMHFISHLMHDHADAKGYKRGESVGERVGYMSGVAEGYQQGLADGRRREFHVVLGVDKSTGLVPTLETLAFRLAALVADGVENHILYLSLHHDMGPLGTFFGSADVLVPTRTLAKAVAGNRRTAEALMVEGTFRSGGASYEGSLAVDFHTGKGKFVAYLPPE